MLLALLGVSFSAMADHSVVHSIAETAKQNTYVGASLGVSHLSEGTDRNDVAVMVNAGTKLHKNFGVEASYAYLNDVHGDVNFNALDLSAKAYYDLTDSVEVSAKAGAALTLMDGRHRANDNWGTSWVVGAGAAYKYSNDVALTADVVHYTNLGDQSVDATVATAGVRYTF